MAKIYHVNLTDEERESLRKLIRSGKPSARKVTRARILLLADEGKSDQFIHKTSGSRKQLCCLLTKVNLGGIWGDSPRKLLFLILESVPTLQSEAVKNWQGKSSLCDKHLQFDITPEWGEIAPK